MGYENFSKFVIRKKSTEGRDVAFVLRRRGIDWKLTEVILPLEDI
jgi:hypothetical protein